MEKDVSSSLAALTKPNKEGNRWIGYSYYLILFQSLFQFIKWEDSAPYKIQELLEEYENLRSE